MFELCFFYIIKFYIISDWKNQDLKPCLGRILIRYHMTSILLLLRVSFINSERRLGKGLDMHNNIRSYRAASKLLYACYNLYMLLASL